MKNYSVRNNTENKEQIFVNKAITIFEPETFHKKIIIQYPMEMHAQNKYIWEA